MDSRESILNSIKKLHGIPKEDNSFDTDIIIHINSSLMILNQIGIGPKDGLYIEDDSCTWDDLIPTSKFVAKTVASFVYVKVRLVFDPPASPTVVAALESSAKEYEWRLTQWAEGYWNHDN